MGIDVIKSYLVRLGFDVDRTELRRFEDALKLTAIKAEKFIGGVGVAAGAVLTGITAVTAGAIGLMDSVAQKDLGFQLFARRMFMGADAAKKLKIATDALGYSLEEIVWGPPELAERYRQLIKDQTVMMGQLSGAAFEQKMRNLRDIRFEFTRMGVEVQYFGMKLTESVLDKLFGGPQALDQKLKDLNEWFQRNIPMIADTLAKSLAPLLREIGSLANQVFTKKNLDWSIKVAVEGIENLKLLIAFLKSKDKLGLLFGDAGTAVGNSILFGPSGGGSWSDAQKKAWWGGNAQWRSAGEAKPGEMNNVRDKIIAWANRMGVDPAGVLAIAQQESGMNPNARPGSAGEIGMFQVLPSTGMAEGFEDLGNLDENIQAGLFRYREGLRKFGGDQKKAFSYYNGSGPAARDYGEQVYNRWEKMRGSAGATVQPQSFTVDVGGIHITQPNATPEQIKRAVAEGIASADYKKAQRAMARVQSVYA